MVTFVSKTIRDTEKFARQFVREILKQKKKTTRGQIYATIIGLSGELGSGKTAFVKGVAHALKIRNTVTSPTFILEKIYTIPSRKTFSKLIHIDAYRLENKKELETLNWNEITQDSTALILIEWPEYVKEALPRGTQKISFKFVDETTRKIIWHKKNQKKNKRQ